MTSERLSSSLLGLAFTAGLLLAVGAPSCSTTTVTFDPPNIREMSIESTNVTPGLTVAFEVDAVGAGTLTYLWEATRDDDLQGVGSFTDDGAAGTEWTAPYEEGVVLISVRVSDPRGGVSTRAVPVVVGSAGDEDGDGFAVTQGDCDDEDASVYPGAPEGSDGIDNDCDDAIDEGSDDTDDDADGFSDLQGDCDDGDDSIYPGAPEVVDGVDQNCNGLIDDETEAFDDDGDGFSEEEGDCDDGNSALGPGASELLDGVDNDCDGVTDENTLGYDDDRDGFSELQGDCDDGNAASYPGATELADGQDNDCDGQLDDGSIVSDDDGDGFTGLTNDCDDSNPYTYPGAPEYADGEDNDCDGTIDDNINTFDNDGDGFAESDGDCNDTNASIYPGAIELDDGIDNDCDGLGYTNPPTAVAQVASGNEACSEVTLTSSASFDPDGDTLDFTWFFTIKPPLSELVDDDITDRFAMDATFVPDAAGYYAVAVQVDDGTYTSTPATVGFTVVERPGNTAPTADFVHGDLVQAGQSTCSNDPYVGMICQPCSASVPIDASASMDVDGDPIRYEFDATHASGDGQAPGVTDNGNGTATLEFTMTAPAFGGSTSGVYEVEVTVTDCNGTQDSSTVTVLYNCQG